MIRKFVSISLLTLAAFCSSTNGFAQQVRIPPTLHLDVEDMTQSEIAEAIDDHLQQMSDLEHLFRIHRANLPEKFRRYSDVLLDSSSSLNLSASQREWIVKIRGDFEQRVSSAFGDLPGAREMNFQLMRSSAAFEKLSDNEQTQLFELEQDFEIQLAGVLVEQQLTQLAYLSIGAGLPKLLLKSPMGGILGISQMQADKIRSRSQAFSQEVSNTISGAQTESRVLIKELLSNQQWNSLARFYNKIDEYLQPPFR